MIGQQDIAIVGLGYVGLPLALAACQAGHIVYGLDHDVRRVDLLRSGKSYIEDVNSDDLRTFSNNKSLEFYSSYEIISKCSIVIICVPTPLDSNNNPDLTILENAILSIAPYLANGTLVISESTSYPGTLRNFIEPTINRICPEKMDKLLFAVAPERVDPGNSQFNHSNTPRIVGGIGEQALTKAVQFYKTINSHVITVSQPEVAEAAKLLENTFRQVNIALVNEFLKIAHVMSFDIREVIEAAGTKPYGFMKFNPGPGVGGHCIPVDPYYLTWSAEQAGFRASYIEKANETNRTMPRYVVDRFVSMYGEPNSKTKILIAGLAYKRGIADIRESPGIEIFSIIKKLGFEAYWYDPLVTSFENHERANLSDFYSGVIITLPEQELPLRSWLNRGSKILDCTGFYRAHSGVFQL